MGIYSTLLKFKNTLQRGLDSGQNKMWRTQSWWQRKVIEKKVSIHLHIYPKYQFSIPFGQFLIIQCNLYIPEWLGDGSFIPVWTGSGLDKDFPFGEERKTITCNKSTLDNSPPLLNLKLLHPQGQIIELVRELVICAITCKTQGQIIDAKCEKSQ